MADEEYLKLVRRYKSGDTGLAEKIINHAFRSGLITLYRLKEDGLPWNLVKRYLHLLNPVIPTPQEHEAYKARVKLANPDWDPRFVDQWEFFLPVWAVSGESWYSNWPEDKVAMSIGFWGWRPPITEGMSARKLRKKKLVPNVPVWDDRISRERWGTDARIAFWGTDDHGLELALTSKPYPPGARAYEYPESMVVLDDIIRRLPDRITHRWLNENGFGIC